MGINLGAFTAQNALRRGKKARGTAWIAESSQRRPSSWQMEPRLEAGAKWVTQRGKTPSESIGTNKEKRFGKEICLERLEIKEGVLWLIDLIFWLFQREEKSEQVPPTPPWSLLCADLSWSNKKGLCHLACLILWSYEWLTQQLFFRFTIHFGHVHSSFCLSKDTSLMFLSTSAQLEEDEFHRRQNPHHLSTSLLVAPTLLRR